MYGMGCFGEERVDVGMLNVDDLQSASRRNWRDRKTG